MPLPEEWVQAARQVIEDEHYRHGREREQADLCIQHYRNMENQRIIEEQDRLWQEALANTREAERQRRRVPDWNMRFRGNTIVHDLSNVTPGSSFRIPPSTYEVDEITVESFFSLPSKPPKPRRRVISPIFLGPAWVDQ